MGKNAKYNRPMNISVLQYDMHEIASCNIYMMFLHFSACVADVQA